jgi:hypothetical protein
MTQLIELMLLASMFIFGFNYITTYTPQDIQPDENNDPPINPFGNSATQKQVLWFIRFYIGNFIYKKAPLLKPLLKPLFMCNVCMSSIYGSLFYLVYAGVVGFTIKTILIWPIFCICLAGLVRTIDRICS